MIVMQYRFNLPADYDMAVIEQRIQKNGSKLDGLPGLFFKTYLISRRDDTYCNENGYAPLYLWKNSEAMAHFLQSSGFKKLVQDFGWPQIDTWLTLRVPDIKEVRNAAWISIKRIPISTHSNLVDLKPEGQLCAWDVSRWQLLQTVFGIAPQAGQENYRIKYVASGI